jgi:hypothetical protein
MTNFNSYIDRAIERGHTDLAKRMRQEKRMASALVRACIDRGFYVSVHNGEDWAIRKSREYQKIMGELWQTDEEHLYIHDADSKLKGSFFLVYGNSGAELIADYTDNEACNAIWNEVIRPLADRMEEGR